MLHNVAPNKHNILPIYPSILLIISQHHHQEQEQAHTPNRNLVAIQPLLRNLYGAYNDNPDHQFTANYAVTEPYPHCKGENMQQTGTGIAGYIVLRLWRPGST